MIIAAFASLLIMGLLCFSVGFRTIIASLLRGAGLYTAGAWNLVWPVIRRTVIIAAIIGGSGWILLIFLMAAIGVYASSFWSAVIISMLFPIWFIAFIMPPALNKVWIIGPATRISKLIFSPVLIISGIFLVIGIWSPAVKGSLNEWTTLKKQEVANFLDKRSIRTEPKKGVFFLVQEDTWAYTSPPGAKVLVKKGEMVMSANPDGIRSVRIEGEIAEGMALILLRNEDGVFMRSKGSKMALLPVRVLEDTDGSVAPSEGPGPELKVEKAAFQPPVDVVNNNIDPTKVGFIKSRGIEEDRWWMECTIGNHSWTDVPIIEGGEYEIFALGDVQGIQMKTDEGESGVSKERKSVFLEKPNLSVNCGGARARLFVERVK